MRALFSRHITPRTAIGLGLLVLVVSFIGGRTKSETHAHAAPAAQRVAPVMQVAEALDPARLRRQAKNDAVGDLFPAPVVAQPQNDLPPVQSVAAAAPIAPPLPFRYLGKALEGGAVTLFVARGEEHYSARAGDRIGRDYRVERVTDKAAVFTYLPLRARQSLALPSSEPIVLE
ncbi:MAG TPA: hypothetical protein VFX67_06600 [Burkholderiales bacterium]|nr:hypothetical protein [Burkholderiales bacterium]